MTNVLKIIKKEIEINERHIKTSNKRLDFYEGKIQALKEIENYIVGYMEGESND